MLCDERTAIMKKTIVVLSGLCIVVLSILGFQIARRLRLEVLDIKPPKMSFRAARQMFPFSVVPGGLQDTRELAESISKDPVVRDHYSDLKPDRMWFMRVKKPILAYVSYRKGCDVRWTTHPVNIPANELVLTDGKNMVRARCGNRIELKKPQPLPTAVIPPDVPPPDIAMDTGLPALVPPTITPPAPPASQIAQGRTGTPPRTSTPPTTWCCGITNTVATVPEPASFFLVFTGALGLIGMAGKKLL